MTHPLVTQLRFTRREWLRALEDVSDEDAVKRHEPMNALSWLVGHMAEQEQRLWLQTQGTTLVPGLFELVGPGSPPNTPPLNDMWAAWHKIIPAVDAFMDTITPETAKNHLVLNGKTINEDVGMLLLRNIYHYWYHLGEARAIRQVLGHQNLPEFVGNMEGVIYTVDAL